MVRAYPDLDHDRTEFSIEDTGTASTIVQENDLDVTKYEGAVVISLDKIEERVKKALKG